MDYWFLLRFSSRSDKCQETCESSSRPSTGTSNWKRQRRCGSAVPSALLRMNVVVGSIRHRVANCCRFGIGSAMKTTDTLTNRSIESWWIISAVRRTVRDVRCLRTIGLKRGDDLVTGSHQITKKRKRRIDIYVTWSSIKQHFIRDILLRISCITSELRGGETPLRHIRRRLRPKLLEERWIRPKWAQFGSFHTDWRDSLPSWFPFRKTTSRRKAKYLDGLISGVAFALPFSNFVYYYFIIISFFFFWLSIFLVSISLVQTP